MSSTAQQILTLVIVVAAASAVLWRVIAPWFRKEKSSGCSTGCGHCPANQSPARTPEGQPLVQISLRPK